LNVRVVLAAVVALLLLPGVASARAPHRKGHVSMTDAEFDRATAAFQAHAASVLQLPANQIHVTPIDAEVATMMTTPGLHGTDVPLGLGHAVGFEARAVSGGPGQVRGWAFSDGTVITYRHELGRFLEEGKGRSAAELATLLVWSMGAGHALVDSVPGHDAAPKLDGSSLRFFVRFSQPGPTPPPRFIVECTLTQTGPRHATLTRSQNLTGPDVAPQGLFAP